jgi:hypothetical protein
MRSDTRPCKVCNSEKKNFFLDLIIGNLKKSKKRGIFFFFFFFFFFLGAKKKKKKKKIAQQDGAGECCFKFDRIQKERKRRARQFSLLKSRRWMTDEELLRPFLPIPVTEEERAPCSAPAPRRTRETISLELGERWRVEGSRLRRRRALDNFF